MNSKRIFPVLLPLLLLFIGVSAQTNSIAAVGPLSDVIVCLDPGHGGSDPGAVNGLLKESVINLDVSFGLKQLLEGQGATVAMTRMSEQSLSNNDRYTFCNGVLATILISVHTNSVTDPTRDGALTFYGPGKSPDLAQAIYDAMYPALGDPLPAGVTTFTGFGVDRFASGVLFKSTMPAAMIEPLFMSHPAEAEMLKVPIFLDPTTGNFNEAGCGDFSCRRGQIAESIFVGTVNYLNGQSGGDNPPTVSIVNPAASTTVSGSQSVAIAVSDEDAPASLTVEWNIDGGLWGATTFNAGSGYFEATWDTGTVGDGAHIINARAIDTVAQSGTAANNVTVQNEVLPEMHVGDLDGSSSASGQGGKWKATVMVTIHDGSEAPVANATVNGSWSDGASGTASCVTNGVGQCSVSLNNIKRNASTVTFTVTSVTHSSFTYNAGNNHPDGDSNGSSIIIFKP